jgi:hypothetical protein
MRSLIARPPIYLSRFQGIRHRQGRLHLQRRTVSSIKTDGGKQFESVSPRRLGSTQTDKRFPIQDQQLQQIVDKTIMEADKDG